MVPTPLSSLAAARQARDDAKRLLAQGRDPSEVKRESKAAQAAAVDTFESIAREYVEKLRREGRAVATLTKIEWLLDFAYPAIGKRSIREITSADVLAVLRKVEARGRHESAPPPSFDNGSGVQICGRQCSRRQRPHVRPSRCADTPTVIRASASTFLNESGKWHPDAIERELGHIESNDVRRAYARGEHWEERVLMMLSVVR